MQRETALLDLPNDILLCITDNLRGDDLIALRLTCHRFHGVLKRIFVRNFTISVHHCCFPADFFAVFNENSQIPNQIKFGLGVKFEAAPVEFRHMMTQNIKNLSHMGMLCEDSESYLYPVEYFHDLDTLSIKLNFAFEGQHIALPKYLSKLNLSQLKTFEMDTYEGSAENYVDVPREILGMTNLEHLAWFCPPTESSVILLDAVRVTAGNLKTLRLANVSDKFLMKLAAIPELQLREFQLDMEYEEKTNVLPFLVSQPNLESLDISGMDGASIDFLIQVGATLKHLKHLAFNFPDLANLSFMKAFPCLETLSVALNRMADLSPLAEGLNGVFPHLTSLKIAVDLDPFCADCTNCCDIIKTAFPKLERLDLRGIQVGQQTFDTIIANLRLRYLSIQDSIFEPIEPPICDLSSQIRLEHVNLPEALIIGLPVDLTDLCLSLKNLRMPIESFVQKCKNLQELRIADESIDSGMLEQIFQGLPELRLLQIFSIGAELESAHWDAILKCKNLRNFELCSQFVDAETLKKLFERLPQLKNFKAKAAQVHRRSEWQKTYNELLDMKNPHEEVDKMDVDFLNIF